MNLSKCPEQLPFSSGTILVISPISPMIPNLSQCIDCTLSVTPYGPGNSRHDWDILIEQWLVSWTWLQSLTAPCASIEWTSSLLETINDKTGSLCPVVLCLSLVWSSVSFYLFHTSLPLNKFTHLWLLHLLCPSHFLARCWCNITEWAQSTSQSHGLTNSTLIYLHTHYHIY